MVRRKPTPGDRGAQETEALRDRIRAPVGIPAVGAHSDDLDGQRAGRHGERRSRRGRDAVRGPDLGFHAPDDGFHRRPVAAEHDRRRLGDLVGSVGLGVGREDERPSRGRCAGLEVELGERRSAGDDGLRGPVVRPVGGPVDRFPLFRPVVQRDQAFAVPEGFGERGRAAERAIEEDEAGRTRGRVRAPIGDQGDLAEQEPAGVPFGEPIVVRLQLLDPARAAGLLVAAGEQPDVHGGAGPSASRFIAARLATIPLPRSSFDPRPYKRPLERYVSAWGGDFQRPSCSTGTGTTS